MLGDPRQVVGTAGTVEDVALAFIACQPHLPGLAVDGGEFGGDLAEAGERGLGSPDEGPGAPPSADLAADQQFPVVQCATQVVDGLFVDAVEACFDQGTSAAVTDHPRVGALTEQQPEPAGDHGLPGARLTCQCGHAGAEAERGVGDHAQVVDAQFTQHGSGLRPHRTAGGGRSLERISLVRVALVW